MTRIGSLCTGYGGLDMAVQSALGGEIAWHADPDPDATAVLAHHHPDVPNLGDITAVDWSAVEPVDIVTAGFPCQDVSLAGKRAGIGKGTRTGLWAEIVAAIGILRPRLVVIENVRGLLALLPMEEPDDRCVCGWPRGWRGLHHDRETERDVCGSGGHRDDDSSQIRPGVDALNLRRIDSLLAAGDGTVGGGDLLDGVRPGSGPVPRADRPASEDQGGSGGGSAEGRGDQDVPRTVRERASLDAGGAGALLGSAEEGQGAESEGTDRPGSAGSTDPDCPACGRPVGDGSGRSVLRSGLEVVLRDLARLGFDAEWQIVRAAEVGAPHGRARLIVLATAQDTDRAARGEWRFAASGQAPGGRAWADAGRRDRASAADADGIESERRGGPGVLGGPPAAEPREGDQWERAGHAARHRGPAPADAGRPGLEGLRLRGTTSERAGVDWGPYEPAIRRWAAVLGQPAPWPTEPGRTGDRLSPCFVEWLMGLPAGHVTAVPGISRNAQLRLLGNGVVPQQVAAALRALLGALFTLEVS